MNLLDCIIKERILKYPGPWTKASNHTLNNAKQNKTKPLCLLSNYHSKSLCTRNKTKPKTLWENKYNINIILEFAKCIYVLEYLKALENIQFQDSGPCANSQTYPHSFLPLHCCLIYFVYVLLSLSPLTWPLLHLF